MPYVSLGAVHLLHIIQSITRWADQTTLSWHIKKFELSLSLLFLSPVIRKIGHARHIKTTQNIVSPHVRWYRKITNTGVLSKPRPIHSHKLKERTVLLNQLLAHSTICRCGRSYTHLSAGGNQSQFVFPYRFRHSCHEVTQFGACACRYVCCMYVNDQKKTNFHV